ncbi:DUF294 nucleotidyltransferase-like domain-containing protein [Ureibacillus acetophenoni]|uniref:CBS domain-containing protein n=1 Tax=Ureibacillus acetophenoni TaxID=614649 RepID=A0A285U2G4_9BACL|nr:DUF294 nucleotidyltransferase-like domain-containing protein [Ureibacillus acetophenoni]SOC36022.1 CBS domain-containing protein [Ureibacillus acetophenoni]
METYESIKHWKDQNISSYLDTNQSLNDFHDQVMSKVLDVAMKKLSKYNIPCEFTWFITGSGGRLEQGIVSDQDHGIIYAKSDIESDAYFLALGKEISVGLNIVGYPYCKGNIMSSNPVWCKSFVQWERQLFNWMADESWESIRYLQIFYDARELYGNTNYIQELKYSIYQYQIEHPSLLHRIVANIKHVRNAIGPLGQIMIEQHGKFQGGINLKYAAFIPYVNSIRLLAIKEGILECSTLQRIEVLNGMEIYGNVLEGCESNFSNLLNYRMTFLNGASYDDTHYLNVRLLTNEQKKEIKRILKDGKSLHDQVIAQVLQ